jgi:hypothetical protein
MSQWRPSLNRKIPQIDSPDSLFLVRVRRQPETTNRDYRAIRSINHRPARQAYRRRVLKNVAPLAVNKHIGGSALDNFLGGHSRFEGDQ